MRPPASAPRIVVALDFAEATPALALAGRLDPELCRLKIGKELFTAAGPGLVETLMQRGFAIFLDLKFHDIPNTVAGACRAAAALGVWMVNVHALGGRAMMTAAREALAAYKTPPRLVAVTLLTSLGDRDLAELGIGGTPADTVLRLAMLARASGLDGVVCSAQEAVLLRRACGADFCLVTPGIRPADSGQDDQSRVMTPMAALAAGADYLVIGRPITRAADPLAALRAISENLERR
ncbi:MAG: orotidine-5'-phosphate decarboxylase [Betaproteobacteria bacterium]|nr:orotidine-5'-phosphate decarboxylase [Betaproteobacteria bacterium]